MARKSSSKPTAVSRDAKTGRFISKAEAERSSAAGKGTGKKPKKK
jgi:hypothetical protein